ncbi:MULTISPECIES: LysM peptidoglycan-binding domain-containing protein [unclassified Fibrobacter]|uniref:LysM peptidoglycan-binding domain-containing protein n=1 Tax=unclassified Fibrobacter TaxID=2634177 RepID=UPI000D6D250A|nr:MULTISPECIES: LysM peptidoglycan-binding domain-containing protein [unclassified Fibrobacter]PWJ71788.1 LysM domain-containing protein [Fibrobacter sp. UWR4]PZW73703.1 LysM domain-containing protein [Fibrobacter sp. UWR1]
MHFLKSASICLGLTALIASAYIIKEGDTLWDLSDEFLNDPFAWPDLWENNRHIQDPHWIYPGDSLYLGDSVREENVLRVDPSKKKYPCDAAVADSNLPKGITAVGCDQGDGRDNEFESMLGDLRSKDKKNKPKKQDADSYFYKQRPAPKIFNGYYQVLAPEIYTIDSLRNDKRFFSIRSGEKKKPLIHIPESEIVVGIGKKTKEGLKKGDLVDIYEAKSINIPTDKGNYFEKKALLRLSGVAKITAIGDTLSRAQVVQSFREIKINQSKAKLKEPLNVINVSGYEQEQNAKVDSMAAITYALDPMLIIGAYSYVLIDKGSAKGYNSGNAVAVWEIDNSDPSIPPHLLGRGVVVRANENEAAILIREIYSNNRRIEVGHRVSVTHNATIAK